MNARVLIVGEAPGFNEDRQLKPFCLEESTLVLTADLRWVPIDTLEIGDKLLAFDEYPAVSFSRKSVGYSNSASGFACRTWKISEVTNVTRRIAKCREYKSELGNITGTPDHLVLTESCFGKRRWTELDSMFYNPSDTRSSRLVRLCPVWPTPTTIDQGWLAGFFDGEGCVLIKDKKLTKTLGVCFTQNSGPTCMEALEKLRSLGFDTRLNSEAKTNGVVCEHHRVAGGFSEVLRFLGSVRPNRLVRRAVDLMSKGYTPDIRPKPSAVLGRSSLSWQKVVDITTTTGTFIANGFAVHNCGDAGREFNENYLPLAGLSRSEIRITNTVRCRPDLNRKPTPKEVAGCSSFWLPDELEVIKPEVVILMGATACSMVSGIDLDTQHGIPQWGKLFDWEGWIVGMYHPAAGLHNSTMMIPMLEDWKKLKPWLESGEWQWAVDEVSCRDYALISTPDEVMEYLSVYWSDTWGFDTESHAGVPWSVQFTSHPNTGRMIRLDDSSRLALRHLANEFNISNDMDLRTDLAMHNAPADLDIARMIGMKVDGHYQDTTQEAYQLGMWPNNIGLKPLSYRVLGRRRESWDQVVGGASKRVLGQWLMYGYLNAQELYRTTNERVSEKTSKKLKPIEVVSKAEKVLRHLMNHAENDTYDTWEKLQEQMPSEWLERLVRDIGEVPLKGIAHCDLETAINYGIADADCTLQLALKFRKMRQDEEAKWGVREEDYDRV